LKKIEENFKKIEEEKLRKWGQFKNAHVFDLTTFPDRQLVPSRPFFELELAHRCRGRTGVHELSWNVHLAELLQGPKTAVFERVEVAIIYGKCRCSGQKRKQNDFGEQGGGERELIQKS
jgi:hypothetical protein